MSGCLVERLVNKVDFERLLATRARLRSVHFAIHHLAAAPLTSSTRKGGLSAKKLSTDVEQNSPCPVDDLPCGHSLGCVVPKRLARRAVTRNLLKRQARAAFERHAAALPAGLWLVRLHAPFAPAAFVSARSQALARAARGELDGLLGRASG